MRETQTSKSAKSNLNQELLGFFKILADIKIRLNKEAGRNGMEYVFERRKKIKLTPSVVSKVEKLKQNKPKKIKIWTQMLIQEGVSGVMETALAAPGKNYITLTSNGRH